MGDEITLSSATMTIILGLLIVLMGILLYKVFTSDDNTLSCWQFIATRSLKDGKHYADLDKLGKVVALFVSSWAILKLSYDQKLDAYLLGVYLGFAGAISGWAAYLRTKELGSAGTTQHTESSSSTTVVNP